MTDTEWHLYCDWHSFLSETLPLEFDAIIYLRTDPKVRLTCISVQCHVPINHQQELISIKLVLVYIGMAINKINEWVYQFSMHCSSSIPPN